MIDNVELSELKIVLNAQRNIVLGIENSLGAVAESLDSVHEQQNEIAELNSLMNEVEVGSSLLKYSDLADWDDQVIENYYKEINSKVRSEIHTLNFRNWKQFVLDSKIYCLRNGVEPLLPFESMLKKEDFEQLKSEDYREQYRWDKWDYIFVGGAGILASLTDYFLVRIPKTMTSGKFAGQKGSPITEWIKKYDVSEKGGRTDWFAKWARALEKKCKVPYDSTVYVTADDTIRKIDGMGGRTHRFQSLGHDPVLGFIFGVLDIMRGTITGFSYNNLTQIHSPVHGAVWSNLNPVGLIEAVLTHIGHLIADVATPMGLPAPFMTVFQSINVGNFWKKGRTIGELARWMYVNGYDFRHFLVSGITPAVIEIVLRAYIMIRHYSEHGETKFFIGSHPKYRSMLLFAHAIAAAGNVGKIALMEGNPLAINYAEWMALVRYLIPSIKYWIFDRQKLRLQHIENIIDSEWNELLLNSERMLEIAVVPNFPLITLGS